MSFLQIIKKLNKESPEKVWLTLYRNEVFQKCLVTELYSRVNDYCAYYKAQGLKQDDVVVIILYESLDLFASFLAGIICGLRPAYYSYPSPKQSKENFCKSVQHLSGFNEIKHITTFNEVAGLLRTQNYLSNTIISDFMEIPSTDNDELATLKEGTVEEGFLQFSSGTTGAKKGIEISSTAFFNQNEAYSKYLNYNNDSKVISWLPHYHDMGLIACMLIPLVNGVPIIMMSPFEWVTNPKLLLQLVTDTRPTHLWLPNFALGHLSRTIDSNNIKKYDLSSLKLLVCCSESLLKQTLNTFIEKFKPALLDPSIINNCYAMAENTFAMTSTSGGEIKFLEMDNLNKMQGASNNNKKYKSPPIASVGKPLPNISIKILDEEGSEPQEKGIGEILIKSDSMLESYHNNREETERGFHNDYFRTGDVGFFHDSELYVLGRKKDVIIIAGENIYAYDIELALNEIDTLVPGRNVVFGITDTGNDTEKLVALAETRHAVPLSDTESIKNAIFQKTNCILSELILVPHKTLKKGTAGKISRSLNKKAYLEEEFQQDVRKNNKLNREEDVLLNLIFKTFPHINADISQDTELFSSGLLDSLGFSRFIMKLENLYQITIPDEYLRYEYFQNIKTVLKTISNISNNIKPENRDLTSERKNSLKLINSTPYRSDKSSVWEIIINNFPIKGSFFYSLLFQLAGIQVGKNIKFLGRPHVKIRGNPKNIIIGDNVILGDGIDIRNRENGKIILEDFVYCDNHVRLVAAREGRIHLGKGTEIGANTVVNSGGEVVTGQFCLIAGNVNINSSTHGTRRNSFIKVQAHEHGQIILGDDVWIGGGVSILLNTEIGEGAIISSNSTVSGYFPPFSISMGNPATILKYRD
jgi:fatty-acyl-CoA synthase